LKTDGTRPGRRIFVDHRSVGQTPGSVVVKCGIHQVQLGSSGKPSTIDIPCDGEVAIGDL
jgi:serine/threonine-protein kinase